MFNVCSINTTSSVISLRINKRVVINQEKLLLGRKKDNLVRCLGL